MTFYDKSIFNDNSNLSFLINKIRQINPEISINNLITLTHDELFDKLCEEMKNDLLKTHFQTKFKIGETVFTNKLLSDNIKRTLDLDSTNIFNHYKVIKIIIEKDSISYSLENSEGFPIFKEEELQTADEHYELIKEKIKNQYEIFAEKSENYKKALDLLGD